MIQKSQILRATPRQHINLKLFGAKMAGAYVSMLFGAKMAGAYVSMLFGAKMAGA